MISYRIADARRLAREIKSARPDLVVERHRDYGFAVDVRNPANEAVSTACQPEREDIGQRGFFKPAGTVIAEVSA